MIREMSREVFDVSAGQRKDEEIQERIQRKRLARRKWDSERTKESQQVYKEINGRLRGMWQRLKRKCMMSGMKGWTLKKEEMICIVWQAGGIKLGRMCSRFG